MGVLGGSAPIYTALLMDTDQFRAELEKALAKGKESSTNIGESVRKGVFSAAKQIAAITLGIKSLRTAAHQVVESVQRLAAVRGIADPATGSFIRMQAATQKLWDGFVLGVLKSKTVQFALNSVADVLNDGAKAAKSLGKEIDTFAKTNADELSVVAGTLAATLTVVTGVGREVKAVWDTAVGAIKIGAGAVLKFIGEVGELSAKIEPNQANPNVKAQKDVAGVLQRAGTDIMTGGAVQTAEGVGGLAESVQKIIDAFIHARDATKKAIDDMTPPEQGVFAGLYDWLRTKPVETAIDAMTEIGNRVGDAWQSTVDRIGKMFDDLSKDIQDKDWARDVKGLGDLMHGFSALGQQVEAVFGKSAAAAKIAARVQLGLLAVEATARAAKAWGDAFSEEGGGNLLGKASYIAAAGAYTATAALAGARAAGTFGNRGLGLSGGGGGGRNRSVSQVVQRQQPIVNINITGNLVDNRDYVRNELIPELRDFVADDGVLPATTAKTAQRIDTGRFG